MTVLSCISFSKAFCIKYSFSGSLNAVASSNTMIGASLIIALAIAILCRSPPERCIPCVPTTVSYPFGNLEIKS